MRFKTGDRMGQRLAAEAGQEVLDRELGHPAAGLDRGAAQVGSDDDVGHRQQGMVAGQRLGLGHVEGRGGDPVLRPSRFVSASRVDDRAAGDVDQRRVGFISESSRRRCRPRVWSVSGTQSIT